MKTIIMVTGLLCLTACSSTQTKQEPDLAKIGEETVIQAFGKDDSLKNAMPFLVDGGMVVSTGFVSFGADGNRPEAGIRMAQINARAAMAKAIENKISHFAQLAEEGTAADNAQLRSLTTEVSKLTANDVRPRKVYYEKVRIISDSGTPRTEYRIWAEAVILESAFKEHIARALRGESGKPAFSKAFQEVVDQNWEKVVEDKPAQEKPVVAKAAENEPVNIPKPEPKKAPKVEEAAKSIEADVDEPEQVAEKPAKGKRDTASLVIDTLAKEVSH